MKKVIEVLLVLSILGLVCGRLLMQYGICNHFFFVVGFMVYVVSFFVIFLFGLSLWPDCT
jgi:hypothetical protein